MANRWFAHDDQMRYNQAIEVLCDEFGPAGDLAWRRLLEVRSQMGKDEFPASIRQLFKLMNWRESFDIDLEKWLLRARDLKLVRARKGRHKPSQKDVEWLICVVTWNRHNYKSGTPEYERDKKRRSRATNVPGRPGTNGNGPGTNSTQTDRQTNNARERAKGSVRAHESKRETKRKADPEHIRAVIDAAKRDVALKRQTG